MGKTVAETIRSITRKHLDEKNGLLFGQAISAVGWVNNTVPDCKNIVEFPMSDVSNMGIACGAAISQRRPIIVIRFQDFIWLNSSPLVNYAAKSKEIFGTPTPIFVRLLAQENMGCVHSGVLHSLFMHMPGFRVSAPMTSKEYQKTWNEFMSHDDPMVVSEHRISFQNDAEFHDVINDNADITLIPISAARFHVEEAISQLGANGIKCNVAHVYQLKPFDKERVAKILNKSKLGLVIDAGYETAGASQSIAYKLMIETGIRTQALGIYPKSVGVSLASRNPTPDSRRIVEVVKNIIIQE